jgi:hypothetical protein
MEFRRDLFPGHNALGVTDCLHSVTEGYCKQCTTCALCNQSLGDKPVGSVLLDDLKTHVYYHMACLDCEERHRRTVEVVWTNKEKGECVLTLKHLTGCRCHDKYKCNACGNAFSYGNQHMWVQTGGVLDSGNIFQHYHGKCLPQEPCKVCNKSLARDLTILTLRNGIMTHSHCK